VELVSLGATVTSVQVPDRKGHFQDIVLGFDNAKDYLDDSNPYMGATVGRVANR
jgi:aldose 1-epimerase